MRQPKKTGAKPKAIGAKPKATGAKDAPEVSARDKRKYIDYKIKVKKAIRFRVSAKTPFGSISFYRMQVFARVERQMSSLRQAWFPLMAQ